MPNQEVALKSSAERYSQYYGDVRRLLASEFSADVRWLTASLFALNAGGLASLSTKNTLDILPRCAGIGFWVGIFLAFLFVTYSQRQTKKFLYIIQSIEECWVLAASTGVVNEAKLSALEAKKSEVRTHFAPLLSAGSFIAFTAGLSLIAWPK